MQLTANILTGLVLVIHLYIVLLETIMFRSRGKKVFGLTAEKVETVAPLMSNQGCYNGFLVAALAIGFVHSNLQTAHAFTLFGLICVAIAGIWGAATVQKRILFVQTVPAVLALIAFYLAK